MRVFNQLLKTSDTSCSSLHLVEAKMDFHNRFFLKIYQPNARTPNKDMMDFAISPRVGAVWHEHAQIAAHKTRHKTSSAMSETAQTNLLMKQQRRIPILCSELYSGGGLQYPEQSLASTHNDKNFE